MAFFDPTRAAYRANPYPSLARLREQDPVHWSGPVGAWVVTRFDDCALILRDRDRFTTDPRAARGPRAAAMARYRESAPLGDTPTLGTTAGDLHGRLRAIVNPLFTPAAARAARPEIDRLTEELLGELAPGQPVDLIEQLADPLPKRVMLGLMGVPAEDAAMVRRWFATIELVRTNPAVPPALIAEAKTARADATAYLQPYFAGGLPRKSVLAALMRAAGAERGLGMDEILSLAVHIAMVGTGPAAGGIANPVVALLEHPGQMQALRRRPALIPYALHELLRYDSPTHIVPRIAVQDVELAGRRVRAGEMLLAMVGAANRDPAAFAEPDTLNLARDARRHLGFGQGEHICLGAPLARVISEAALAALLRRFDRLELAAPAEYRESFELRLPERLLLRAA
ncbi:MAG: cytochrome P450 [Dehalococcoidia bacterium]